MALVNGSDYDHIDLHSAAGGDVTRHMLKDAQARSDVGELKSAIYGDINNVRLWKEGYYGTGYGVYSEKTESAPYCCTIDYIPESVNLITCESPYKVRLHAWNNGTYVGAWGGSSFVNATANVQYYSSLNITSIKQTYIGYRYKLVVVNGTSATTDVPLSDTNNVSLIGVITWPAYELTKQNAEELSKIKNIDIGSESLWKEGYYGAGYGVYSEKTASAPYCCTIDYIPESVNLITCDSPYKVRLHAWNNGTYVGAWGGSSFVTVTSGVKYYSELDLNTFKQTYSGYRYKLVLVNGNSNTTDVPLSATAGVHFNAPFVDGVTDALKNKVSWNGMVDYIGTLNRPNKVIKTDKHPGSSMTFVNDLLYVFAYSSNDDYSTPTTTNHKYRYNQETGVLEDKGTFSSNMGHQNTTDYCAETDYMISASGGNSSNTMPSEIFLFPGASSRASFDVTSNDVIRIDVSSLDWGKQLNCVWGEPNNGQHNIIYCLTNYEQGNMESYAQSHPNQFTGDSKRYIRRVLLGKGTNQLENGIYNSSAGANEFNGTFKVVGYWEREFVYAEANNDTCFFDGRIYENIVKSDGGQCYVAHEFNGFGTVLNTQKIEIPVYKADGTAFGKEGEGIAIRYGKLFIGSYRTDYIYIYDQWRKF